MAYPKADGTVGVGLTVIFSSAVALHVDGTIIPGAGFSGSWSDSVGRAGILFLTPGAGTGGPVRPVVAPVITYGSISGPARREAVTEACPPRLRRIPVPERRGGIVRAIRGAAFRRGSRGLPAFAVRVRLMRAFLGEATRRSAWWAERTGESASRGMPSPPRASACKPTTSLAALRRDQQRRHKDGRRRARGVQGRRPLRNRVRVS